MLNLEDLFQWERFITPSIIKVVYWLALCVVVLCGASGVVTAIAQWPEAPVLSAVTLASSVFGVLIGIVAARIAAELILIVFRINEHLGAIRERGELH